MTSALTLRLPDDLKEKCSDASAREKKTLNKWFITVLEDYFAQKNLDVKDAELEKAIQKWYDDEFVLTGTTAEYLLPTVNEFLREAAREKMLTSCCPECGNFTRADAKYCSFCGEKLKDIPHPDDEAASVIYDRFCAKHKGTGDKNHIRFVLVATSFGFQRREYAITEQIDKTRSKVVLAITREMLDAVKCELEKDE
ncbi:MAG TPA: zinc ribbon domain-containing protein [Methanocorpusculum sp.]|nr:zinc ribbon domain-containing protein [Methanocorpusculum sp.]